MRVRKNAIATAVICLAAASVLAQDRKPIARDEISKYVVSAKAGVVNLVEGQATVRRSKPFAVPDTLISGDELQMGDAVQTGAGGRAEILLNPGCYLRLGEQSEFVFLFDDFTSDKLRLLRGSAVLEASAIDGLVFVETPSATFEIARDGLYRFNVSADGKADAAVRKGRLLVGDTSIKEGKRAVLEGGTAVIARFNKKDTDALDDWSKGRAKALIAANSKLSNRGVRSILSRSFLYDAWIYDPFCRCYTFLPSGGGFASPYGGTYSVCNPYWYLNPRYNNGGWYRGGNAAGNGGGNGRGSGSGSSTGGSGGHQSPPPMTINPGRGAGDARGSDRGPAREAPAPISRRPRGI